MSNNPFAATQKKTGTRRRRRKANPEKARLALDMATTSKELLGLKVDPTNMPMDHPDYLSLYDQAARRAGISRKDMVAAVKLKFKDNYDDMFRLYIQKYKGTAVSLRDFDELLLLDDFGLTSLIGPLAGLMTKYGLPWIAKNGAKALNWGLERIHEYLKPKVGPSSILPDEINQFATSIKETTKAPVVRMATSQYDVNAVNLKALAQYICPEDYCERLPSQYTSSSCGLASFKTEVSATTDANGNVALYIFPHALVAGATAGGKYILNTINYATTPFNPQSGIYDTTNGCAFTAGPYNSMTASVRDAALIGCSVQILPTTSLNTSQGRYETCQFFSQADSSFTTNYPYLNAGTIPNLPYYTLDNMNSVRRLTYAFSEATDLDYKGLESTDMAGNPSYTHGWYILFTGCVTSTNVARIKITGNLMFHPTATAGALVNQVLPTPGAATLSAIQNITNLYPAVYTHDYKSARELAEKIQHCTPTVTDVIDTLPYVEANRATYYGPPVVSSSPVQLPTRLEYTDH